MLGGLNGVSVGPVISIAPTSVLMNHLACVKCGVGYIVRGLADAPSPEGRGAERVHNLKE